MAIVTRKAMILGNQGQALSSTDEEGAEFQRLRIIVQSGDEISQRVMTKKCFGQQDQSQTQSQKDLDHDIDEEGTDAVDLSSTVPLLYRNL